MRHLRRRRRILQFSRRDIAGGKTRGFRQLKDGLMIFFVDINAQRAVIAFHAGGPRGCRSGGIRHVIRLAGFFIQRIMGVLARQRQGINTFKETACAFGIISCGGNF